MFDDFTTTGTTLTQPSGLASIATNQTSGYNFYPAGTNGYNVFTTATAATLKTFVPSALITSGGTNAGAAGIWSQTTASSTNGNAWTTAPPNQLSSNGTSNPIGSWNHGYFEAYLQYNSITSANAAFWAWNTGATFAGGPYPESEIDIMETEWGGNVHNWTSSTGDSPANFYNGAPQDNEWHTYGLYWQSTGAGQGSVRIYIDNVAIGNVIPTGTAVGSKLPGLENGQNIYLIFGPSPNPILQTLNVDWVRVWGA